MADYKETINRRIFTIPLTFFGSSSDDEVRIEHTEQYHELRGLSYSATFKIEGPRGGVRYERELSLDDVNAFIAAMGEVKAQLMATEAGDSIYDGQRNFARAKQLLESVTRDLPVAPELREVPA